MVSASSGLLVLIFLSLLAWIAAVAVAGRTRMAGRVELLLTACLVWIALIELPAYGLGWANLLYPWVLAGMSCLVSASALLISGVGRHRKAHLQQALADVVSLAKLPLDALIELIRERGFALIGLVLSMSAIFWTTRLSYLGPPAGWDGLWYQDTMVGFAIQNHGFRVVDVPQSLTVVNSLPRICETLNLWFAIFGGRRFVVLPNMLMAVPLVCAVFLLVRRYTTDREYGIACASAMLLMPGVMLRLRSTTIDLTIMALTATALHFSTRPRLRLRDVWLAACALGLLLGTRFIAVAQVPAMGLVLAIRLFANHWRTRPAALAATAVGGATLALAIGAPNYLRNWFQYHNLFWPHTDVSQQLAKAAQVTKDAHHVIVKLLGDMLSPPVPGKDWPDTHHHGYGLGIPALILPLGLCATLAATLTAARSLVRPPRQGGLLNLLYTAAPLLAIAPLSPTLAYTRHNLPIVIAFLLLATWLVGGAGWERVRQGVGATLITTSIVLLWWASPRWFLSFEQAVDLFGISAIDRPSPPPIELLPDPTAARARETELKPGDIVAFTDSTPFPAVNWNEHFTNRLVWIPSALGPERELQRAVDLGAKWMTVTASSPEYSLLRTRTDAWQEVGRLTTTVPAQVAFRRVGGS